MRCCGNWAPRRKVDVGGFEVRCAQSRGECPGLRITFLDGRFAVASVELVATKEFLGPGRLDRGARSTEAAEGGGVRLLDVLGRGRSADGLGGGGINKVDGLLGTVRGLGGGRAGGGIAIGESLELCRTT